MVTAGNDKNDGEMLVDRDSIANKHFQDWLTRFDNSVKEVLSDDFGDTSYSMDGKNTSITTLSEDIRKFLQEEEASYISWEMQNKIEDLQSLVSSYSDLQYQLRHTALPRAIDSYRQLCRCLQTARDSNSTASSTRIPSLSLNNSLLHDPNLTSNVLPADGKGRDVISSFFQSLEDENYDTLVTLCRLVDSGTWMRRAVGGDTVKINKWRKNESSKAERSTQSLVNHQTRLHDLQQGTDLLLCIEKLSAAADSSKKQLEVAEWEEREAKKLYEVAQQRRRQAMTHYQAIEGFVLQSTKRREFLLRVNDIGLALDRYTVASATRRREFFGDMASFVTETDQKVVGPSERLKVPMLFQELWKGFASHLRSWDANSTTNSVETFSEAQTSAETGTAVVVRVEADGPSEEAFDLAARVGLELVRLWRQLIHSTVSSSSPPGDDIHSKLAEFETYIRKSLEHRPVPVAEYNIPAVAPSDPPVAGPTTVLFFEADDNFLHQTPEGHCENPARVGTAMEALKRQFRTQSLKTAATNVPASDGGHRLRPLVLEHCESITAPPLWTLPLVHAPKYLRLLWDLSCEAAEQDLFVPLEFDTDQESEEEEDGMKTDDGTTSLPDIPIPNTVREVLGDTSVQCFSTLLNVRKEDRQLVHALLSKEDGNRSLQMGSNVNSLVGRRASRSAMEGKRGVAGGSPGPRKQRQRMSSEPCGLDPRIYRIVMNMIAIMSLQKPIADAADFTQNDLSVYIHGRASKACIERIETALKLWFSKFDEGQLDILEKGTLIIEIPTDGPDAQGPKPGKADVRKFLLQQMGPGVPQARRKLTVSSVDLIKRTKGNDELRSVVKTVMDRLKISQGQLGREISPNKDEPISQNNVSQWFYYRAGAETSVRFNESLVQWLKCVKSSLPSSEQELVDNVIIMLNEESGGANIAQSLASRSSTSDSNIYGKKTTVDGLEISIERSGSEKGATCVSEVLALLNGHEESDVRTCVIETLLPTAPSIETVSTLSELVETISKVVAPHIRGWRAAKPSTTIASSCSSGHGNQALNSTSAEVTTGVVSNSGGAPNESYVSDSNSSQAMIKNEPDSSDQMQLTALATGPPTDTSLSRQEDPESFAEVIHWTEIRPQQSAPPDHTQTSKSPVPVPAGLVTDLCRRVRAEVARRNLTQLVLMEESQLVSIGVQQPTLSTYLTRGSSGSKARDEEMYKLLSRWLDDISPSLPVFSNVKQTALTQKVVKGKTVDTESELEKLEPESHMYTCVCGRNSGDFPRLVGFFRHQGWCRQRLIEGKPLPKRDETTGEFPPVKHGKRRFKSELGLVDETTGKRSADVFDNEFDAVTKRQKTEDEEEVGGFAARSIPSRAAKRNRPVDSYREDKLTVALQPSAATSAYAVKLEAQSPSSPSPSQDEADNDAPLAGMPDTYLSASSLHAALRGAGAACRAVDLVVQGGGNCFVCVRPPGHHAGRYGCTGGCASTGFCLLNNAAIAVTYARVRWGLERVAVVDIDVHFGNGTAELLKDDPRAFFASVHMIYGPDNTGKDGGFGFYPDKLGAYEKSDRYVSVGIQPPDTDDCAEGWDGVEETKAPVPISPIYKGPTGFRAALSQEIIPALNKFDPELLIISAGFDGYFNDPLGGQLQLTCDDYMWATEQLLQSASRKDGSCRGRVVSLLEGGYDTYASSLGLAKCVDAHVKSLRGGCGSKGKS